MSVKSTAPVLRSVRTLKVATTASVHSATGKWVMATCARRKVRVMFSWPELDYLIGEGFDEPVCCNVCK